MRSRKSEGDRAVQFLNWERDDSLCACKLRGAVGGVRFFLEDFESKGFMRMRGHGRRSSGVGADNG
ncbi:hypothetical protein MA16_Dca019053 [Dendrobium catenatum]|uniref:Uncharacterized protein n=1 Tax=Dendrobium catenatum TaxID=906689 RepID=A0A2I0W293_9ASPA|nr:hypothetical protein MA16_Dca019053 [Dendrobium catenatum]